MLAFNWPNNRLDGFIPNSSHALLYEATKSDVEHNQATTKII